MGKILIAEDDAAIALLEKDYLEMAGFETEIVMNGNEVLSVLKNGGYDLVLLDVMLPGQSGYEICKLIRAEIDIPILMVTARTESTDKIYGLRLGADDYISKPFDPAELVARVKSHLNRYARLTSLAGKTLDNDEAIVCGSLKILKNAWKVYKNDVEVKLAKREFELLLFLAENPNTVFSKEQIFEKIWGCDFIRDSATVMVHINRIRDKIEDNPTKPVIIETVWGAGYKLTNQI